MISTTSSPDFLKKRINHFILFPEPASAPLPQAVLHQSNAFPAPGKALDGSQIIFYYLIGHSFTSMYNLLNYKEKFFSALNSLLQRSLKALRFPHPQKISTNKA